MSFTAATVGMTNLLSRSLYTMYNENQLYDIISEFLIIFDGNIQEVSKALSEYFRTDGIHISADDFSLLFRQVIMD